MELDWTWSPTGRRGASCPPAPVPCPPIERGPYPPSMRLPPTYPLSLSARATGAGVSPRAAARARWRQWIQPKPQTQTQTQPVDPAPECPPVLRPARRMATMPRGDPGLHTPPWARGGTKQCSRDKVGISDPMAAADLGQGLVRDELSQRGASPLPRPGRVPPSPVAVIIPTPHLAIAEDWTASAGPMPPFYAILGRLTYLLLRPTHCPSPSDLMFPR
eukprot:gene6900-1234_t